MVVSNPEISSLQAEIDQKISKSLKEQEIMRDDFEKLNHILMIRTVDELFGTITESLPKSKDDPTRTITEKDRQRVFDFLFDKYFMGRI